MPHPHLGFRFVEERDWAVLNGPAGEQRSDPRVLVLACSRREFLIGVLIGISARLDCVHVRYRLDPVRGVHRAEARFTTEAGAGEVAATLKGRGFRPMLHPVILDETWWAPFRSAPIPDGQRWTIPLDADSWTDATVEGAGNWPWACGRAYTEEGRNALPSVKICLASWDRKRMDAVLAALTQHPRCYGVKGNHPNAADVSFLGRAVFVDEDTTGWVARQLEEQCPDVVPVVQDDAWFKRYRVP
ncbi:MAG: hypothetical protein R3F61_07785 [Myxococcota bacterium]